MRSAIPNLPDTSGEIERLTRESEDWNGKHQLACMEIERLRVENNELRTALEVFGRNADNVSLSGALGHICREDLWRARALAITLRAQA